MIADGINIRTFEPGDQHIVKKLILGGLSEHFDALDPTLNKDLENISATYLTNRNIMLVAELDGKILATGALIREAERTGRIVRVSVDSAYRRCGV